MDIRQQIQEFETIARRLEPSREERAKMQSAVLGYAEGFLDAIYEAPVFNANHNHGRGLYESPLSDEPIDIQHAVDIIRRDVDEPALNPASGGHMGYIPGGGVYPAALGDYLADVANRFAGVYHVGPGAVRMEHMLVRWMCDLIGYGAEAGGDLTSGGSIANLSAVVAARDAHEIKARDFDRVVLYLSPQTHHSIHKSIRVAGLGECVMREVEADERYRIRPESLERLIEVDRANGLMPWMLISAAGTTDTGAVDPLAALTDVTDRHGLWHHVDASYGGFFLLCEHGRRMLEGIDRTHSTIMDPHKGLFLPYGTGAVLTRERDVLARSHYYTAPYMQDVTGVEDEYSPADHSAELTRHFRGLRMWMPLKVLGIAAFRACLEEKLLLARYFYGEVQKLGFEVGPEPDLSVAIYRWVPEKGDANEFNLALTQAVHDDGRVFLTSTTIDGVVWMRMAALAFRTHLDRVDMALEVLQEKVKELEAR